MIWNFFVRPKFEYDYISSPEDTPSEMLPKAKSRRFPTIQTFLIIFLSMGWIATLLSIYIREPQHNGTLRVYSQSPIPKEVFTPVKRIFEPEERFVGDGINVTQSWDTLVAGKYKSAQLIDMSLYTEYVQVTMLYGSSSQTSGISPRAFWLRIITPTLLLQNRRTFTSFPCFTKCIA